LVSRDVWVIAKINQNELLDCTIETLSEGRLLANSLSGKLCAIVFGDQGDISAEIFQGRKVDRVYLVNHSLLKEFTTEGYVETLSQLVSEHLPFIILATAASDSDDFMPRLAARINSPLVTGCIQVTVDDPLTPQFIRPSHANKVYKTITCSRKPPFLATLLSGVIGTAPSSDDDVPEIMTIVPDLSSDSIQMTNLSTIQGHPDTMDIREANIVIAGGKGACTLSAWKLLEDLADVLCASIGGSRMALDEKFIKSDRLIGQTGKYITPSVYITAGISGAYYHVQGVHADLFMAINTDRYAPIFSVCKFGFVGDMVQILPILINLIRQKRKQ
jgi:electron transfer flavoprotein alpha subunit